MRERYLLCAAVFFSVGIITVRSGSPIFALCAAGVLVYLFCSGKRAGITARKEFLQIFIMSCLFLLGFLRAYADNILIERDARLVPAGEVTLTGRIISCEDKETYYRLIADKVRLKDGSFYGKAVVLSDDGPIALGTTVYVKGEAVSFRTAQNDGGYDEKSYYRGQSVFVKVYADDIRTIGTPVIGISESLRKIRERINTTYGYLLPGEEAGILSAMSLGDKSALSEEVRELFTSVGMSHILAISGLHISAVGSAIYGLLKRILKRHFAAAGAFAFVYLYAVMCGGSISAMRAVWMYAVLLGADVSGEGYDSLSALSVAAMMTLLHSPCAIGDIGFIFSYGVMLGINAISVPIGEIFDRIKRLRWESTHRRDLGRHYVPDIFGRIEGAFVSDIAVWLFGAPIAASVNYEVPVFTAVLCLIMLPVLSVVLLLGLLAGVAGTFLGYAGAVAARVMIIPVHFILYAYEWLSDKTAGFEFSSLVTGHPSFSRIAVYYALLFAVTFALAKAVFALPEGKRGSRWRAYFNGCMVKTRFCLFLLAAGLLWLLKLRGFNDARMDMLFVGQGDGIYIESSEGERFFIDGGSSSENELSEYTLLPFLKYHGADHIDTWIISHPDADHYNGMLALVKDGFVVDNLVVAKGAEKTGELALIEDTVIKNGGRIVEVSPGDSFGAGSLSFTCIYPYAPSRFSGTNENSLILWMSDGDFDMLFTGDTGSGQEDDIIRSEEFIAKQQERGGTLEVLKVAHHGSKFSSDDEFLDATKPTLALISVGKNSYGHPAPETISRLLDMGIDYLTTLECGQITVRWNDGGMYVRSYNSAPD